MVQAPNRTQTRRFPRIAHAVYTCHGTMMLNKGTEQDLLTLICNRKAKLRISMFADDAVILLNPVRHVDTV